MFITVQIPFVDLRRFRSADPVVLDLPFWPLPRSGDFVRGAGGTLQRPLGGVGGWVGEAMVCDASRAIRFKDHPSYTVDERDPYRYSEYRPIPKHRLFHVPFRRLYFDGLAVGKFELGFSTGTPLDRYNSLKDYEIIKVLEQVLSTVVKIPPYVGGELPVVTLARAGTKLARFYGSASHPRSASEGPLASDVQAGQLVVFVQLGLGEVDPTLDWRELSMPPSLYAEGLAGNKITQQIVYSSGIPHRVWMLDSSVGSVWDWENHRFQTAKDHVRALRIAILRLHAEKQALREVQRAIISGRLRVKSRSVASDRLQLYLGRAISRIRGKESRIADLLDRQRTIEWIREFEALLTLGEGDELVNNMELLALQMSEFDFRPNVIGKVLRYQEEVTLVFGDQYINNGQAGSMGPASSGSINNNPMPLDVLGPWNELVSQHSWEDIQQALQRLTPELQRAAQTHDQREAVRSVQNALNVAEKRDGAQLIFHLKRAGTWASSVASKVGADVITKLILEAAKIG